MSKFLNIALTVLILGLLVSWWYRRPKYNTDELAPDFTTTLLDGSSFSLSDLQGQYVLLDFWGSWCGPCRRENPRLVELYEEHGDRSFSIVSVAIERHEASMRSAIQKDALNWKHHIPQLQRFDSPVPILYGVKEIPTTYLIDPEGKIIGVNLRTAEIDAILTAQL